MSLRQQIAKWSGLLGVFILGAMLFTSCMLDSPYRTYRIQGSLMETVVDASDSLRGRFP